MSFKLLLKQSFRNIAKKMRLYLSLILFLFVASSILIGTATFFSSWRSDITNIIYTGKQENFEIPKFKFEQNDSSDQNKAVFRFTESGEKEFIAYAKRLIKKGDLPHNDQTIKDKINQLGQASGDISAIGSGDNWVNDLSDATATWGHNLMQSFIAHKLINEQNVQIGNRDYVTGTDGKDKSTTLLIRPLATSDIEYRESPFFKNGLNEITHYKTKVRKDKGDLIPFLVTPNYLRYTGTKIGDNISIVVNNNPYKGYIEGTAVDKYHIFFNNESAGIFTDIDTLKTMSNGNYINSEQMIGYLPIKDSSNAFDNSEEYSIAYKKINHMLLSNGNDPNATFERINSNNKTTLLTDINETNAKLSFYKNPMGIYSGFMIVVVIVLVVLIVIVSYFIIDESIRSEKKTLWFLKALGETNMVLSLLNSMSAVIPLLIALGLAVPGTMLIMEFYTIAISTDYAFTLPWYALTYISAIAFVCLFIGILVMFVIINEGLISGKALSIQTQDKLSRFQIFLNKITNGIVAKANGKFRVGFAFVKQNLIKNLVTFVLFLVVFSVSLFGVQFMRSITNQEYQYQDWMGSYKAISTLSPKQTITWDKTNTTYKTISKDELKNERYKNPAQFESSSTTSENNSHLVSTYNYDMFKYISENWFNGIDYANLKSRDWWNKQQNKNDYFVFDSDSKTIVNMPDKDDYYQDLTERLEFLFGFELKNYCSFDEAAKVWDALNNGDSVIDKNNETIPLKENPNNLFDSDFYRSLDETNWINAKKTRPNSSDVVSVAQWSLRQFKDVSLWDIDEGYIKGLSSETRKLPKDMQKDIDARIDVLLNQLPSAVKPAFQSIVQVLRAQKDVFGVSYPFFGINFGDIIKPDKSKGARSAVALSATYKGTPLLAYGLDPDDQPFTKKVAIPRFDEKVGLGADIAADGMKYKIIHAIFSANAKNQRKWKVGDIVPVDTAETGLNPKDGGNYLALEIDGFDYNDSVLTEAFFDKKALNNYITDQSDVAKGFTLPDIDNTLYTKTDVPYFLQHITVPHMEHDGTSVDDYIYTLDTFTSNHKTTAMITKVFADTVDSYSSLMEKIIILLVVIAVAISSIIITLILLENKKTILLFKAMGYGKSDVIWYIISGYLIAAVAALVFSFAISAGATIGLAPMFASTIYLELAFTAYWLWFVLGIILTVGFMALVIISVLTYTRYLKPRDAFATL